MNFRRRKKPLNIGYQLHELLEAYEREEDLPPIQLIATYIDVKWAAKKSKDRNLLLTFRSEEGFEVQVVIDRGLAYTLQNKTRKIVGVDVFAGGIGAQIWGTQP